MASFGSFETDREVYSGTAYTVYSARKTGDPQTEYAVKVFSLHGLGLETEAATELDTLLNDLERACVGRITVQQQAAAASKYVTPILEHGRDERGVWYATKFYPRSVNKIISGRVALSRDALEHIVRAMAEGALDIKRACGRSHGDIVPSNVQISRSEKMVEAEVVLSDPLPGDQTEAARYELSDLHSIGRILLQLVLRREIDQDDTAALILPILASPEWSRLFGKDTNRWLALCNRLLDPNLSLEQFTLDRLVEELDKLRYAPPVSKRGILVGAAALAVLMVAAVFAVMHYKRGRLLITTDPPGAEIKLEVEGQYRSFGKTPTDKTPLSIKRPKGSYQLRAEYRDLPVQTNAVTVEGGKTSPYQFVFPYGLVKITSTPTNAAVELDGKAVGFTPYTSPFLAPGKHTYRISLTNHHETNGSVVVLSNRQEVPVVAKLNKKKDDERMIEISFVPFGATIMAGTNVLGETSLRSYLTVGSHTITAHLPDWPPVTREIMVGSEENQSFQFRLPHGVAEFKVDPEGAKILVNRIAITNDPPRKALQPANYTVLVTNIGYYSFSTNITITDSNVTRLSVSLKPMVGFVEFTTDPPGAVIFDAKAPDKELGRTPFKKSFPPDTSYSFLARIDGLDPVTSTQVNVAMGANVLLPLAFKYGTVQFRTEPQGADVLIAGKKLGTTPYDHRQKPGPVSYRVEMPDYYLEEGAKDLAAGASLPVSFRLRPKDVNVVLRSDPAGAQFFLADAALRGTNDLYVMPWGAYTITAKYPSPPGLPGLEVKTDSVQVDKSGNTKKKFEFAYATLELTNAEPDARLLYQNKPITNFPARLYLKPDSDYDFVVEYGEEFRTNLPVKLAANKMFTPRIVLPELRRLYTNSIGMAFVRVSKELYAAKFEVTEEEYQNVMGRAVESKPRGPVVNVKWDDAVAFCQKLTQKDTAALDHNRLKGWSYALPTDAEWARFVERDPGQLSEAVFGRLEGPLEIDPARKSFNRAGLYDLFGNVAEWCSSPNNQPTTIGGAHNRPRPRQYPEDLMRINDPARLGTSIAEGSPTIGFRCVLRTP
jgi:hypothetical protein